MSYVVVRIHTCVHSVYTVIPSGAVAYGHSSHDRTRAGTRLYRLKHAELHSRKRRVRRTGHRSLCEQRSDAAKNDQQLRGSFLVVFSFLVLYSLCMQDRRLIVNSTTRLTLHELFSQGPASQTGSIW